MASVKRFCTSAIYVKEGKVTVHGSPSDVADVYLVDNIESMQSVDEDEVAPTPLSKKHSLKMHILEEDDKDIKLEFAHDSSSKEDMYIGISDKEYIKKLSKSLSGNSYALKK